MININIVVPKGAKSNSIKINSKYENYRIVSITADDDENLFINECQIGEGKLIVDLISEAEKDYKYTVSILEIEDQIEEEIIENNEEENIYE